MMNTSASGFIGWKIIPVLVFVAACSAPSAGLKKASHPEPAPHQIQRDSNEGELRLTNMKQLTFEKRNSKPRFSHSGRILFQSDRAGFRCDQLFGIDEDGTDVRLVSTGLGSAGYGSAVGSQVVFSSTHGKSSVCPSHGSKSHMLSASMDVYQIKGDADPTVLASSPEFDGEPVLSPQGDLVVFTSKRGGDADLWSVRTDGSDLRQLTSAKGYDGSAALSHDGTQVVYQHHPAEAQSEMELWVMNSDGSGNRLLLSNGAINVSPSFHPAGDRVVFSSNLDGAFSLYLLNTNGQGLERITYGGFDDKDPVFSQDADQLLFTSRRFAKSDKPNVFLADWDESPKARSLASFGATPVDAKRWHRLASELASESFAGRALGSPELEAASSWLAAKFGEAGLAPGAAGWKQEFDAASGSEVKEVVVNVGGLPVAAAPLLSSGSGSVRGKVVSEAAYESGSVEGQVVVVQRETSPPQTLSLRERLIAAEHRGAAAVIVVNSEETTDEWGGELGLPVVQMSAEHVVDLLGSDAEIKVEMKRTYSRVSNVVGVLRAGETPTQEVLVIGAHYDHLGMGGEVSRAAKRAIHPGADDNASGVAMILEIARSLKGVVRQRDIYFVGFTGEESGLLGSSWMVKNPPWGKARPVVMLNFDMVGRLGDAPLSVLGVGTGKELADVVRRAEVAVGWPVKLGGGAYAASDHMTFYASKIPVLAFFTGLHDDYHKPSDSAEKLDLKGASLVGELVLRVVIELAGDRDVVCVLPAD